MMAPCGQCGLWLHFECIRASGCTVKPDESVVCPRCQYPAPLPLPPVQDKVPEKKAKSSKAGSVQSSIGTRTRLAQLRMQKLEEQKKLVLQRLELESKQREAELAAQKQQQEAELAAKKRQQDAELEALKLQVESEALEETFRLLEELEREEDDDGRSVASEQSSRSKVRQWQKQHVLSSTIVGPAGTAAGTDQQATNPTTSRTTFSQVPERVRAMNATIKLLLIVREPVTRAISDYTQLRSHAATATLPQQQSLSSTSPLSRSFEDLAILPNGTVNEAYRPLAISQYHVHVHRWLEVFSREQLLVVNGDQLIEDPVSQLRRIEDFLGIEPRIGSNNFYFNETKGFYCLRNETGDKCLRETKGRKHPRVDPVVVSKLRKFFVEHNQKFYELVGEDLGWPEE